MRKLIERILTVGILGFSTTAILPLITGDNTSLETAHGNSLAIAVQMAVYSCVALLIAGSWHSFVAGVKRIKGIGFLVAIAIASTAWSQDPSLTLRRSLLLFATTAFAIYFATRYEISEQLELLAWTLGIVIGLSFIFALFLPRYGIDHVVHEGDWQGVFSQKNVLARIMVLSVLVFAFAKQRIKPYWRWLGLAGGLALLVLSRSLTGIVVLALLIASIPLIKLARTKMTFGMPTGLLVGLFTASAPFVLVPASSVILGAVHRNRTLTGRTDLWQAVMESISKRPLLGYGFDAFWQGMKGESANVLMAVRWPALHAHNGFLAVWLDLGILGLATFLGVYFLQWRRAFRNVRRVPGWVPIWYATFLAFTFFYNLTESALVAENSIFWILFTATAVGLATVRTAENLETASPDSDEL